ncbi:hypothetical protein MSG28_008504 [Choristoneura fumiferana]|uniref:Uncharacterized protein n=1 Tax=Choristoneura fumiferana TaxID=7141 RepID=A0ACC0J5C3_CHOFU|nr:hypothetical protein MSG28_008504 [Choristoneura fumiferana]
MRCSAVVFLDSIKGRTMNRNCSDGYNLVTQNFDGSPMKEVLCVKCARGYKPSGNACVRCAGCACARNEVIVRDACVPRSFVNARQKYEGGLHPYALLDVVKYEYLCIEHAKRRLPQHAHYAPPKLGLRRLPALLIESPNDKDPDRSPSGREYFETCLRNPYVKRRIHVASEARRRYYSMLYFPGDNYWQGFILLERAVAHALRSRLTAPCSFVCKEPATCPRYASSHLSATSHIFGGNSHVPHPRTAPLRVPHTGENTALVRRDCHYNVSDMPLSAGDTLSPFLQMGGSFNPLPVALRKPNGSPVKVNNRGGHSSPYDLPPYPSLGPLSGTVRYAVSYLYCGLHSWSVQRIGDLPRDLVPSTLPCTTSCSMESPSRLETCPKYYSMRTAVYLPLDTAQISAIDL